MPYGECIDGPMEGMTVGNPARRFTLNGYEYEWYDVETHGVSGDDIMYADRGGFWLYFNTQKKEIMI